MTLKTTNYLLLLLCFIPSYSYADDNNASQQQALHTQLKKLNDSNLELAIKISLTDKSLSKILFNLKALSSRLDFKLNEEVFANNKNSVSLSDFETKDDNLMRKCDEIVDNFYDRKLNQEKNYVNTLLNSEQLDPEWANSIETQLQDFLDDKQLTASSLSDIQCKTTVCRFSINHQTNQAASSFKSQLRSDSNWDLYNSQNKYDRATGEFITTVTLIRDKRQLRHFIWNK